MARKRRSRSKTRSHRDRVAPTAYVVAGPNGAGKTTFATEFLPHFAICREFLNADLIAAGLSPFAPETQNVQAARLMLSRLRELVASREDFGFETTLAGRSYLQWFKKMQSDGYRIVLCFLWLPNSNLAQVRVSNRVRQGGHDVPPRDVRRRFAAGLKNFRDHYASLVDEWRLYDSSTLPPQLIARSTAGEIQIADHDLYDRVQRSFRSGISQ
jgi:predicted ABC-type ATPase